MSVKPSEAINNGPQMKLECNSLFTHTHFAKYTPVFVFLTGFFPKHLGALRISQRWVLNILRWSNEGRMPTNNGPQMKLGYDNLSRIKRKTNESLLIRNQRIFKVVNFNLFSMSRFWVWNFGTINVLKFLIYYADFLCVHLFMVIVVVNVFLD